MSAAFILWLHHMRFAAMQVVEKPWLHAKPIEPIAVSFAPLPKKERAR